MSSIAGERTGFRYYEFLAVFQTPNIKALLFPFLEIPHDYKSEVAPAV